MPVFKSARYVLAEHLFGKAGSAALATFEIRPGPGLPAFKSFQQIQKLLALTGLEFINAIYYKIEVAVQIFF